MTSAVEIEDALRKLPVDQARAVADWLQDYLVDQWDRQIEQDARSGKIDRLAAKALAEYKAGKSRPIHEVPYP